MAPSVATFPSRPPGTWPSAEAAPSELLAARELSAEAVLGRMGGENFPVALRVLPRARREALVAVYGAARLIDEAGDAVHGDRVATLDAVEADLRAAACARAWHPLLARLTPLFEQSDLDVEPFLRLLEANRWDQHSPRLASWQDLEDYCALSAAPIGRIVLTLFDQSDVENRASSDAVCTALQVLEHCQDVAEDAAAGRIYLPAEDRARFGCEPEDLVAAPATPALRRTVALEIERARALLEAGRPFVRRLRGLARFVVAGYVAGGLATADALERSGYDPNSAPVRPRRAQTLLHGLRLLLRTEAA